MNAKILVFLVVTSIVSCATWTARAIAAPFTFLQAPFTQEVFGVAPTFIGGLAFAPDGDVWADECLFGGSPLFRFDLQTTIIVNSTTIHPLVAGSPFASAAGCGLTNHPDGTLYSNTSAGVTNLDADTAASLRAAFGPGGDALGMTTSPVTGEIIYAGSDGTIQAVDPVTMTSRVFSSVTTGDFIDGLFFDPSGAFLFASNRSPTRELTIIDSSTGNLVQNVPLTAEPDGIAFRAVAPKFVVTSNTDGTMTRFDFPSDDFSMTPSVSQFASGGFRGDLTQVGADGCLYITQDGTRYDDGTTDGNDSVVRICSGFAAPSGIENCNNGSDDDGDQLVDCADPDCATNPLCAPTPTPTASGPIDGATVTPTPTDTATPTATATPVAPATLDHFDCYEVDDHPADGPAVQLENRFGASSATLGELKRLCDPATKNGEDPTAPGHPDHLIGYTVADMVPRFPGATGEVVVNQFGVLAVDLSRPNFFLVPASESRTAPPLPPNPAGVDHFTCYRVRATHVRLSGIQVVDELGTFTVDVKRPSHLCVPTDKNGEGILDSIDQLLCYQVRTKRPRVRLSGPHFFSTQFGAPSLAFAAGSRDKVTRLRELCVPSQASSN